jgi:uncharacterized protein YggE
MSPIAPTHAQESNAENSPPKSTSSVQGAGVGTVTLKPTHLRLSIPLKVVNEVAWDATEQLRQLRHNVEDRAKEMGALEGSIRTVGFQCGDASNSSSGLIAANLNRGTAVATYEAKCYLVVDFKIRKLEDYEAMIAMSQSQVEELTSLLPKQDTKRRSYSYSSMASGLSSQQLENPLALFFAEVSDEDRVKAFEQAFDQADAEVKRTLKAMGVAAPTSIGIHQNPFISAYSSSRQRHPVEAALYRPEESVALSLFPDAVSHTVRVNVNASIQSP